MNQKFYSTIVLSDLHLGTEYTKINELIEFLRTVSCNNLILNGDIIDGWHLQKGWKSLKGKWKKEHTEFFKIIMKMMENSHTSIYYIRGNHDDFIEQIAPLHFANFSIVNDLIFESKGKKYLITHGDIFDNITSNMVWLAKLGDVGYTFLLWLNRVYNSYRLKKGYPYSSVSQRIKLKVKSAVSYISNFENELTALAKAKHVDGVICGHIHQPANKMINGIHYLNAGDWVESLTALLQHEDGSWEIYRYEEEYNNSISQIVNDTQVSAELIHEPAYCLNMVD